MLRSARPIEDPRIYIVHEGNDLCLQEDDGRLVRPSHDLLRLYPVLTPLNKRKVEHIDRITWLSRLAEEFLCRHRPGGRLRWNMLEAFHRLWEDAGLTTLLLVIPQDVDVDMKQSCPSAELIARVGGTHLAKLIAAPVINPPPTIDLPEFLRALSTRDCLVQLAESAKHPTIREAADSRLSGWSSQAVA